MSRGVKPRDQVVTGGGIVGKVTRVDDEFADVEIAHGVKIKVVKSTLSDVLAPGAIGSLPDRSFAVANYAGEISARDSGQWGLGARYQLSDNTELGLFHYRYHDRVGAMFYDFTGTTRYSSLPRFGALASPGSAYWAPDHMAINQQVVKEGKPFRYTRGGHTITTVDDYLRFVRMLLGGGEVDGVRVLSEESVRLMRTDRLTEEQKRQPFLGMPYWIGRGFGLNLSVITDPAKSAPLFGPGGLGTFSWPGAYGTWWQADPANDLILIYKIQNYPDLTSAAAAVAGNTSLARLQSVQPRFVRRTYGALGL